MPRIIGNRHAPFERAAADRKIAQATAHEGHDFVAASFRTNKVRVLGVQLEQPVTKFRKLEKIVFFVNRFRGAAALGAGRTGTGGIHVEFVVDAVLTRVGALVDVAIVANPPPQSLHAVFVAIRGSADEIVIGETHPIPKRAKFTGNLIGELLRGFASTLACPLNFLAVLVGAGEEISVRSEHALAARYGVTCDGGIGVTNVRPRVDIVNRSRDVELFAHLYRFFTTSTKKVHETAQSDQPWSVPMGVLDSLPVR